TPSAQSAVQSENLRMNVAAILTGLLGVGFGGLTAIIRQAVTPATLRPRFLTGPSIGSRSYHRDPRSMRSVVHPLGRRFIARRRPYLGFGVRLHRVALQRFGCQRSVLSLTSYYHDFM